MQDRFKFRLYDKAIGEMVYDVCVGFIKDSGKTDDWVCADTSCGQITYRGDKLKDIVLMQCTGLKDKNGKFIYEGDIIKDLIVPEYPYIVKWFKGEFKLKSIVSNSYLEFDTIQQEVIGNIYENPELLKNGE